MTVTFAKPAMWADQRTSAGHRRRAAHGIAARLFLSKAMPHLNEADRPSGLLGNDAAYVRAIIRNA